MAEYWKRPDITAETLEERLAAYPATSPGRTNAATMFIPLDARRT
jgi:hypothetical protein